MKFNTVFLRCVFLLMLLILTTISSITAQDNTDSCENTLSRDPLPPSLLTGEIEVPEDCSSHLIPPNDVSVSGILEAGLDESRIYLLVYPSNMRYYPQQLRRSDQCDDLIHPIDYNPSTGHWENNNVFLGDNPTQPDDFHIVLVYVSLEVKEIFENYLQRGCNIDRVNNDDDPNNNIDEASYPGFLPPNFPPADDVLPNTGIEEVHFIRTRTYVRPTSGTLEVIKVVDWGEFDQNQAVIFEICITGPSYPQPTIENGGCQFTDFDGGTLIWDDQLPGSYIVDEVDPVANWSVQEPGEDSPATVVAGETTTVWVINTYEPIRMCNPQSDLQGWIENNNQGFTENISDIPCNHEIGMASYMMFDEGIDNQVLFDSVSMFVTLLPNQPVMLSVRLPDCAVQVDLFYGPVLQSLNGQRYGERLLAAILLNQDNYCTP